MKLSPCLIASPLGTGGLNRKRTAGHQPSGWQQTINASARIALAMASAATRRPPPEAQFPASSSTAQDRVLLDALPIAAAVISRGCTGTLTLDAHNNRFE